MHLHANKSYWRYDPTRTSGTRRHFIADVRRRYAALRKATRELIVDRDVLGLKRGAPPSAAAIQSFMRQFEWAQRFLQLTGTDLPWVKPYVGAAYKKGLQHAVGHLVARGRIAPRERMKLNSLRTNAPEDDDEYWIEADFGSPQSRDREAIVQGRVYSQVLGVSTGTGVAIQGAISNAITTGMSAQQLANQIADQVNMSRVRAERVARTEVINAHAEATLNAFEQYLVEGVDLQAEFSTAEDEQVCSRCQDLAAGGPYAIEDARGLIPVHPNCRCAWLPIVE